jgi:hypothetical protein
MKKICILLGNEIVIDSRVVKTINSLSKYHCIDLFYIKDRDVETNKLFNSNVRIFGLKHPHFKTKGIL